MRVKTDYGEMVEGDFHNAVYFRASDGRVFYSWEVSIIDNGEA